MFYFHYSTIFAKIKCFLRKIEKMFDFYEKETPHFGRCAEVGC